MDWGGHLVLTDLLKLDTAKAASCNLTTDDSCYYLVFRYPDLKEYDVFNRFEKVSISKKTMMPVAVRQHQESYGRIQDLFFRITFSRENEGALAYDFFAPVFLKTYQLAKSSREPGPASNLKTKPAPGFDLPAFSGEMVSLNDLKGKVVLLDFWEVWCGPCIQSMPEVQKLYEKYKSNGLSVYGIVNDTANIAASKEMVKKRKIDFPMLQGSRLFKDLYGINGVPVYIVIDRSGIITLISEGFSDEIEVAIRAAL
jgi:thiol-disulfide isomerase/thioredoxin